MATGYYGNWHWGVLWRMAFNMCASNTIRITSDKMEHQKRLYQDMIPMSIIFGSQQSSSKKMKNELESRIQQAMRSRLQHFRNQADCLTFEGVRRLLEKDLVLDTYALDEHKKYVKQLLEKYLSGTEDEENVSKDSKQNKVEQVKEEEEEGPNEKKVTDIRSEDEVKVEDDSPVMGLLSAKESAKSETLENAKEKLPTEDMIKEALWTKATYFRSKSEELTVAGVRRLLEEDLELRKFSLDSFKKLISKQLDEVLNAQSDTGSKSDADASHSESDDIQVEVRPKKNLAPKRKVQKSEAPRKRKKPAPETERVRKKKMKHAEETSVDENKVQDEDESSEEKSVKKEVVAPVYGKKVERLKSIIKACGMSVAPTVYKKAKQAPEEKREALLINELQQLLSKEGLSTNPSEKEIKEVKRRKEKAKELEGIDMSNIVVGSRRRSTFNFVPPPKPKAPIESDSDDESEDSENDDGDGSENTDNDNEGGDGDAQDEDDDAHASHSEEDHEGMTRV
ncbi:glutamic acid-rich protein-like protein isoform X1 [Tanacetum coccineum]